MESDGEKEGGEKEITGLTIVVAFPPEKKARSMMTPFFFVG